MNAKNLSPEQEQRAELARNLLATYRSGIRPESGFDMPSPEDIVGNTFDSLGIPTRATGNETMAATVKAWLTLRSAVLLRQFDPRLKSGLQDIRRLIFFYYHEVDGFLSNAQLSGDNKTRGRFTTIESLHTEWEKLTGLRIPDLSPLNPYISEQELDVEGVLPVSSRTATNSIDDGFRLMFGIEAGRARTQPMDISIVDQIVQADQPTQQVAEIDTVATPEQPKVQDVACAASPAPSASEPKPIDPQVAHDIEALIHLARSVAPDQAFSKYSTAFALSTNINDAEEIIDRWLAAGWVKYIGYLHAVEAYVIPDSIRREAKAVVKVKPFLGDKPVTDFGEMLNELKPTSPLTAPYAGTNLAKRYAQSTSASVQAWSTKIIGEMEHFGTLDTTQQMLRAQGKPLLVDKLSMVIALQERTQQWLRFSKIVMGVGILSVILFGISIALIPSDVLRVLATTGLIVALLALTSSWGVLHQTARAWQVVWAEMVAAQG